uniref:Uncharacterized protein LOC108051009 n=1 Tax=Drosophila rhopaloa TaxID=1041015 RepID=A0A6P4FTH1_DRORH
MKQTHSSASGHTFQHSSTLITGQLRSSKRSAFLVAISRAQIRPGCDAKRGVVMSSLADVQSVLKSTFSSSELRSTKKNQLKMAKIALIFLLFALFAVAMAGRVTREEATKSPVEQFQENFDKILNSDQVKQFQEELKNLYKEKREELKQFENVPNEGLKTN